LEESWPTIEFFRVTARYYAGDNHCGNGTGFALKGGAHNRRTSMKRPTPITPKIHGILDYATSSAVALAPAALALPKAARPICYGLAVGYACLSLMTKYPTGVRHIVPFKGHGAVELLIGLALPFVPRMIGAHDDSVRSHNAQLLFCGLSALTGVVAYATDWNSAASDS
jgi:hypothetical protein